MIECYIGLGSNMGDRMSHLARAAEDLGREPGIFPRRTSTVYESAPLGPPQPRYLNAVAQVDTLLSPRALLQRLVGVEQACGPGRFRRERWGPREIDLDLLLYAGRVLREPWLEVPHPRLHERAFVLAPLSELSPEALHPLRRQTMRELLAALPAEERGGVRQVGPLRRAAALLHSSDRPGD